MENPETVKRDGAASFALGVLGTLLLLLHVVVKAQVLAWVWNHWGVAYGAPPVAPLDAIALSMLGTYALAGLADRADEREGCPPDKHELWARCLKSTFVALGLWGVFWLLWELRGWL